jgi:hypothetical protein
MVALAFTGCGGGGGGGKNSSSGGGTGSTQPPPPDRSINRNFNFGPVQAYAPPGMSPGDISWAETVAIGDVTGDGRPDVVVGTEGVTSGTEPDQGGLVMVFPQLPDKSLGTPVIGTYLHGYASSRIGMAIGDLDGDGKSEVVVGHQEGLSIAKYRVNEASLSITRFNDIGFTAVEVKDFDTDGKLDVLAQTWSIGAVLFKGDGAGGLARLREVTTPLKGYNHVVGRDMNNDARQDLVLSNGQGERSWFLMLNDGTGGFLPPKEYALPARSPNYWPWTAWGLDSADLNGDGLKDVVVSLLSNRPAGVGIYLADKNGNYTLDRVLESYDMPQSIALADLDGNGLTDIVTLHGGWFNAGYYLQGPSGFDPEVLVSIGMSGNPTSQYRPDGLAVGDINSDGCKDVAIADYQFGLLVLLGKNCRK